MIRMFGQLLIDCVTRMCTLTMSATTPRRAERCRLMRNILADKPRVTKFPIEFDAQTIPTMAGMPGEHSMDHSLAGDMIEGMQPAGQPLQPPQSCAGTMGAPPAAGLDVMMEG
jgi:hypothetical protein